MCCACMHLCVCDCMCKWAHVCMLFMHSYLYVCIYLWQWLRIAKQMRPRKESKNSKWLEATASLHICQVPIHFLSVIGMIWKETMLNIIKFANLTMADTTSPRGPSLKPFSSWYSITQVSPFEQPSNHPEAEQGGGQTQGWEENRQEQRSNAEKYSRSWHPFWGGSLLLYYACCYSHVLLKSSHNSLVPPGRKQ